MEAKEFRLIVAGGRDFNDYNLLATQIDALANGTYAKYEVSIVSGMARGADSLAVKFARNHDVMLHEFPADWSQGRGAGFNRNRHMAMFADGLLAFWDRKSLGTAHMIESMRRLEKPVVIVYY